MDLRPEDWWVVWPELKRTEGPASGDAGMHERAVPVAVDKGPLMRNSVTRRRLLLGALALPCLGVSRAAPKAPIHPMVFLSSELQPLHLAAGDGRIFADIKEVDAAFEAIHPRGAYGSRRWIGAALA